MKLSDTITRAKHDLRTSAGRKLRLLLGRSVNLPLPSKVSPRSVKRLIKKKGFAVAEGKPSWFYTAYDRGSADPLTNFALKYIIDNMSKDREVLVTGCGTGITAFYLADHGFQDITGVDLLPECIEVANGVKDMGAYGSVHFFVGNGFAPTLPKAYDVITALHWVFSAWMGNYGNNPVDQEAAASPAHREKLLREFLSAYIPYMKPGSELLVELTDAVTDYRIASDHPLGELSRSIYPVRHSAEQVAKIAGELGLIVVDKHLCVSYGHHPRTLYILRRG